MAGALAANDLLHDAIGIWKKILHYSPKEAGLVYTQMGLSWGKSIINDAKYKIAKAYYKLYRDEEAKKYLRAYLEGRKHSRNSLFSRKDALKLLNAIEKDNKTG